MKLISDSLTSAPQNSSGEIHLVVSVAGDVSSVHPQKHLPGNCWMRRFISSWPNLEGRNNWLPFLTRQPVHGMTRTR
jgi:hypothetical protein